MNAYLMNKLADYIQQIGAVTDGCLSMFPRYDALLDAEERHTAVKSASLYDDAGRLADKMSRTRIDGAPLVEGLDAMNFVRSKFASHEGSLHLMDLLLSKVQQMNGKTAEAAPGQVYRPITKSAGSRQEHVSPGTAFKNLASAQNALHRNSLK
jgi:hypothetical protein